MGDVCKKKEHQHKKKKKKKKKTMWYVFNNVTFAGDNIKM